MRNNVRKAFTLVEILIVVVILGILAAIVIPQFTNASTEAQAGNVQSQLQTIRSQIELFRVKNNGSLPDMAYGGVEFGDLLAGTNNTHGLNSYNSYQASTDAQEPYMRQPPKNPRINSATAAIAVEVITGGTNDPAVVANRDPVGDAFGWVFNSTTGNFAAVGWVESTGKWFGQP